MKFTDRIFPPGDPRAPFHTAPDDMIDVWRASYDGASYVIDREPLTTHQRETVTREKMSRATYESLREFAGF